MSVKFTVVSFESKSIFSVSCLKQMRTITYVIADDTSIQSYLSLHCRENEIACALQLTLRMYK